MPEAPSGNATLLLILQRIRAKRQLHTRPKVGFLPIRPKDGTEHYYGTKDDCGESANLLIEATLFVFPIYHVSNSEQTTNKRRRSLIPM
jgi:hypothetical protein